MTLKLGKDFKGVRLYKILDETLIHYGFKYKLGENIDTLKFNPSGSCESGGLYFTDRDNIMRFLDYGDLIATIKLDDNESIYCEEICEEDEYEYERKYKAHKIFIEKIETIINFFSNLSSNNLQIFLKQSKMTFGRTKIKINNLCVELVKKNQLDPQLILQHIEKPTYELCLEAVKHNGLALEYIERRAGNKTYNLYLEAVTQNGLALEYVKYKSCDLSLPYLCLKAVKQNGLALKYVKIQTEENCLEAVKQNGLALEYVTNQTHDICLEAIKQNNLAIKFIKYQNYDVCLEAIKQNKLALKPIIKLPTISKLFEQLYK